MSSRFLKYSVLSLAAMVLAANSVASAAMVVVNANDSGWFRDTGESGKSVLPNNQSYFVGTVAQNFIGGNRDFNFRDFFAFDLSGITSPILAASLQIMNTGAYTGAAGAYTVYDVTTSLASMDGVYLDGDATGQSIYADLGTGSTYGSQPVDSTASNSIVNIAFGPAGVAALNAAVGNLLIVGGDLPLGGSLSDKDMYGSVGSRQLVLTTADSATPEPGTLALLGLGLVGSVLFARRKGIA